MTRKHAAPQIDANAIGFSYLRFSTPDQAKGDSYRRQTGQAEEWCQRHGITLDKSLWLFDPACSAYTGKHRENPDRHALAAFLELVGHGRVPKGSYLIIENLDRLSREHERPALRLWMDLLDKGVNIVQLTPETVFRHELEYSDMFDIMRAVMELSRGHGEGQIKSERVGAAWGEKKRRAREGEPQRPTARMGEGRHIITRRLPAWVEERGGKLVLIADRAAVVRRIFALAAGGYGLTAIVRRLMEEGASPFGTAGHWARSYVALILKDRRAMGECQPKLTSGKADGPVIAGYFPAAVTEAEWLAARAGAAERKQKRGRNGSHVNVFAGLMRHALDGDTVFALTRTEKGSKGAKGRQHRVLMNSAGFAGRTASVSFPFEVFETAILSLLREIDPHEILNGDSGPDDALVLAGQLAGVESAIALLAADLDANGESPALYARLRAKEAQHRELAAKLAEAQQKAAHPLSASWGEMQSLADVLASAPDPTDARLRLRSALRRVAESIWLVIVPRGRDRLCAVQVWFAGGKKYRDYLILHRPAKGNASAKQEGGNWAIDLASVVEAGELDFRDLDDAATVEKVLEGIDPDRIIGVACQDLDSRGGRRQHKTKEPTGRRE